MKRLITFCLAMMSCFIVNAKTPILKSEDKKVDMNWKIISFKQLVTYKVHEFKHDFNKDGVKETIVVHLGTPQPFLEIHGIHNDKGYPLAIDANDIENLVDEFGINEGVHVQITSIDLDNDNRDELIITIGNKLIDTYSIIYKVRHSDSLPFVRIAVLYCPREQMLITNNKEIYCPIGFQGLGNRYKMHNGRIITNGEDTL